MIYAAFTIWLFGILFLGIGLCRVWTSMARPSWVHWALLPGTVVSEMAYIFGCLITGGEIRRAKLLGSTDARRKSDDGEPTTEATQKLKVIGPIVASLLAVVACGGAIIAVHSLLGEPVIREFITSGGLLSRASLPRELPGGWNAFWTQIAGQVRLLKRMGETCGDIEWLDWRVALFVYLSTCFAVRLAPIRRDLRATLAAVVVVAGVIALIGAISTKFTDLLQKLWPLLTYIWTSLLFLLVLSLLIRGIVSLAGVLAGRKKT